MFGSLFCTIGKALGGCKDVTPVIQPCATIGLNLASSILLDKLDEIQDADGAAIYLPDNELKIYKKVDVQEAHELEEVASIKYIAEIHDCDDFAAKLFGKFAGLVWSNLHALCFFIDETNTFYFIEPQTGKISQTLEGWQGSDIRFFIGR
uniref:Agglutinin C-terminal domain-containing protein n=1 Tax=viral metagenome TaxID=1070528 RepID=A0A6M3KLG5_9ZZZZ